MTRNRRVARGPRGRCDSGTDWAAVRDYTDPRDATHAHDVGDLLHRPVDGPAVAFEHAPGSGAGVPPQISPINFAICRSHAG